MPLYNCTLIYSDLLLNQIAGCPNGTYGPNCLESCMCTPEHESSPCDVMNGTCFCLPDYTGSTCDVLSKTF